MAFSITTAIPPNGAPVHYYGSPEAMTTNPTNTIATVYVAGVPSSINITELATGNTTTVTAGGSVVYVNATTAPLVAGAIPGIGILLPDKTIITASTVGTMVQDWWWNTTYSAWTQPRIIQGFASLLFGSGANFMSTIVPYQANGYTYYYSKNFQEGLMIKGTSFTITDAADNTFSGTITHAIGY